LRRQRPHVQRNSAGSAWLGVSLLTWTLFMWLLVAAQNSDHPLPWYLLAMVAILIGLCSAIIALVQFVAHGRVDSDQTR
jgi:hypothetical protein